MKERGGLALGALGVLAFSVTLPATRAAVPTLGPAVVGLGRSVVAGCLGIGYLLFTGAHLPSRRDFAALLVIVSGVVFGFPVFAALAMRTLPASHGAVVTGLIPCATAVMAVWRAGERPPILFWLGCFAGVAAVLFFATAEGAGSPQPADALLLCGVLAAALGYAEGTRLTRRWGEGSGIRVISWAMALGAPYALVALVVALRVGPRPSFAAVPVHAWLSFAYLSVVSAYLGFFPWYAGLAKGGVARVGQVQLIQPILTLGWSVLLLGEALNERTVAAASLVVASAGVSVLIRQRGTVQAGFAAAPGIETCSTR